MNWWLEGTPGAIMARQGYYMSVTEPLGDTLSDAEWLYWYGGEPASEDLRGASGKIIVNQGERREGGSYQDRIGRVAVWSTIMPEHNYLLRRWRELIEL
jgi:putative spermidine/putrescine transport system substrate-binding protein